MAYRLLADFFYQKLAFLLILLAAVSACEKEEKILHPPSTYRAETIRFLEKRLYPEAVAHYRLLVVSQGEEDSALLDSICRAMLRAALSAKEEELRRLALNGLLVLSDQRALEVVVRQLKGPDEDVRIAAIEGLLSFPSETTTSLLRDALGDSSPWVQIRAAEGLVELGAGDELDEFVRVFLGEHEGEVVLPAVDLLSQFDREKARSLLYDLIVQNPPLRPFALRALGRLSSHEDLSFIASYLSAVDLPLQRAAIEALTLSEQPVSLEIIQQALLAKDPFVRRKTAQIVAQQGGEEARHLLDELRQDENPSVRLAVAEGYWLKGEGEEAVKLFRALIDSPYWGDRLALLHLLGQLRDESLIHLLRQGLKDSRKEVVESAYLALAQIGTAEALEILDDAFFYGDINTRRRISFALRQHSSPQALPLLLTALSDRTFWVRRNAIEGIERIGAIEAIPHLTPFLDHSNLRLRLTAARATAVIVQDRGLLSPAEPEE